MPLRNYDGDPLASVLIFRVFLYFMDVRLLVYLTIAQ